MARGLKFRIKKVWGVYNRLCRLPINGQESSDCSVDQKENEGADQLHGKSDLHLCFCIYSKSGFLMTQLILEINIRTQN